MNGQVNGTMAAIDVASHDFSVFANSIASFQRPRGKDLEERARWFLRLAIQSAPSRHLVLL